MSGFFDRILVIAALSVCLSSLAIAGPGREVFNIPVDADESVISGMPDRNYSSSATNGGLFTGVDGGISGSAHFYLRFTLPAHAANTVVQSAILRGYHFSDYDASDNGRHEIDFVGYDAWSESALTWDNQPGPTYGTPETYFMSAPDNLGQWVEWDLTPIVAQEYRGDGQLSLLFKASNEGVVSENRNWENFVEREFDASKAFELTVVTVPVPPAIYGIGSMLGMLWGARRWVRRSIGA